MGSLSIGHWLIFLLVVVLVFGTKKLRNMGSDLGSAVKGFKDGLSEGQKSKDNATSINMPDERINQPSETINVSAREKSKS